MRPYYEDAASGITIYCGDCREIAPPTGALMLTDPPYGISHSSNYVAPTTTAAWMNTAIVGDESVELRDSVISRADEWACFGSYKTAPPPGFRGVLVWDKGPQSGMGDLSFPWKLSWELIFVAGSGWNGSRDEGVLKGYGIVTRASMGRTHPNEKPIDLLRYLMLKHHATTIVDPFMGTGATLRAAKDLGRRAIGIEIEERYCEIAARRLDQGVLNLSGGDPNP